jgi:hypothetical protein
MGGVAAPFIYLSHRGGGRGHCCRRAPPYARPQQVSGGVCAYVAFVYFMHVGYRHPALDFILFLFFECMSLLPAIATLLLTFYFVFLSMPPMPAIATLRFTARVAMSERVSAYVYNTSTHVSVCMYVCVCVWVQ